MVALAHFATGATDSSTALQHVLLYFDTTEKVETRFQLPLTSVSTDIVTIAQYEEGMETPIIRVTNNSGKAVFEAFGYLDSAWQDLLGNLTIRLLARECCAGTASYVEEYSYDKRRNEFVCAKRTLFMYALLRPDVVFQDAEPISVTNQRLYLNPTNYPDEEQAWGSSNVVWRAGILLKKGTPAWVVGSHLHNGKLYHLVVGRPEINTYVTQEFVSDNTLTQGSVCGWLVEPDSFQSALEQFVAEQPAHIAVSVDVLDYYGETVSHYGVNELDSMIAMSVLKLPIAVVAFKHIDDRILSMDKQLRVDSTDFLRKTYSPLRDSAKAPFSTTFRAAMWYALNKSDNIGADLVIDALNGVQRVNETLHRMGFITMGVGSAYRDLTTTSLMKNWSTSGGMNQLLRRVFAEGMISDSAMRFVSNAMESTKTGKNRIRGLLPQEIRVANKTGTYSKDSTPGDCTAVNDVGIIELPNGGAVVISVFVNNAMLTLTGCERVIAQIARMVYDRAAESGGVMNKN